MSQGATLVTGGSGFIGKNLVKKFGELGTPVVCVYHFRLPEPMANVYPVCSDLSSSDLLAAPLRGVETVIHLAWENNFVGPGQLDLDGAPNIFMLKNLLSAMEKAGTRRMIFMSALGAKKNVKDPFLKEKYFAEHLIMNSKIPEKIIFRPTIVCGQNRDRFLRSIIGLMNFPAIYPVPRKDETISPLHIDDLVEAVINATDFELSEPCAVNELVGKDEYKIEELFKLVSTRYSGGKKMQIRGALGDSLLPLFERDSQNIRLKHLLTLGDKANNVITENNPLDSLMPKKQRSFSDIISEKSSI